MQAYILCLVLGVGSRLIPALLGFAPLPTEANNRKQQVGIFVVLAVLFLLSFVIEALGAFLPAQVLRSVVITFMAVRFWNLHTFPQRKVYQSWWIWVAAYFVVLGHWGIVFFPSARIHLLHLILVSGLGLMTLMIASRVTLSHGKHDMGIEKNSKALFLGAFLMCAAGATRASAGITAHIYQSHLLYASYLWIGGLIVWGWIFLPKLFKIKNPG
ncbi:NnrS protein [compost metagenome]